jgi:membrane fusion protein (multidrug efflux system)
MKAPAQRFWLLGCASAVLVSALACGLTGCEQAESAGPTSDQAQRVPVRVAEVRLATMEETVRGIGTLRAAETVEIKPETDGLIAAIHVEEGARVERKQLLVSIDDQKLRHELAAGRAALKAARVRLADAERLFRRMQDLVERGAANQDELDDTETAYLAAQAEFARQEAQVDLIQARLDDTRLVAPFAGIISERTVDVGDFVKAGDYLATLYRISQMEIAFTLPERFIGRVQPGQTVAVSVAAYADRAFAGKVYFVSPQVDESTRDFLVKATLENPEGLLKPGTFGSASVTVAVHEQRPVIPEEALVATREGYIAFAVEEQVARRREVTIGLREAGVVEVRAGLEAGETVVRAGQMSLSDGTPVRITEGSE